MEMTYMETLSQAMNRLRKDGYEMEISPEELKTIDPAEWKIEHICRFEGMSNPDDNSILYAIARTDGSSKALIVNAYGVYASSETALFIEKVKAA